MGYDVNKHACCIDIKAAPDESTYYYYNADWQVLAEHDGTSITHQYVYGNTIDEPLIMNDGTDDYYYAHNHLFSTVALTDDTGAVVERYEYNAYGTVTVYTDDGDDGDWYDGDETTADYSAIGNPYTFTGRRLDVLGGNSLLLMCYRYRTYDPYTGRFLQTDPAGYIDTMNLYAYCGNNPVNWIDPWGLWPQWLDNWLNRDNDDSHLGFGTGGQTYEDIMGDDNDAPNVHFANYIPPPTTTPPAFPNLRWTKPKNPITGGGGKLRKRWTDPSGNGDFYEWDYQHGRLEKYNKQGKHQGEFDPKTGKQTKPRDPNKDLPKCYR